MPGEPERTRRAVVQDDEMEEVMAERYSGRGGHFSGLPEDGQDMSDQPTRSKGKTQSFVPAKSIEGWILIVRGIHEEGQEEHIYEAFDKFGEINNLHLNLDRRTGYVKGYALVEFAECSAAEAAIAEMNGAEIVGQRVSVDWAFMRAPKFSSESRHHH